MSASSSASSGVGLLGWLGVLFIGLKLTGFITWSWWLVTLPLWGGLALVLAILALLLLAGGVVGFARFFASR